MLNVPLLVFAVGSGTQKNLEMLNVYFLMFKLQKGLVKLGKKRLYIA